MVRLPPWAGASAREAGAQLPKRCRGQWGRREPPQRPYPPCIAGSCAASSAANCSADTGWLKK